MHPTVVVLNLSITQPRYITQVYTRAEQIRRHVQIQTLMVPHVATPVLADEIQFPRVPSYEKTPLRASTWSYPALEARGAGRKNAFARSTCGQIAVYQHAVHSVCAGRSVRQASVTQTVLHNNGRTTVLHNNDRTTVLHNNDRVQRDSLFDNLWLAGTLHEMASLPAALYLRRPHSQRSAIDHISWHTPSPLHCFFSLNSNVMYLCMM